MAARLDCHGAVCGWMRSCMRSLAQLNDGSACCCTQVPVTGPWRKGAKVSAAGIPIRQKMSTQSDVADQSAELMFVEGCFSLTHEGTVVTKPKLKRMVPSTPATEPVTGLVLMAGSGVEEEERELKQATNHTTQQKTVRTKAPL